LFTRYDRRFYALYARIFRITSHQWSKPRGDLARCQLADLPPQRATWTQLALRWRLRPGRRAPRRSFGHLSESVAGPVLPIFGRFGRPLRRTSTPSGNRRGPCAAAGPQRGKPGPVGVRWGDVCAAVGAVGRQRAICPRMVSGGPLSLCVLGRWLASSRTLEVESSDLWAKHRKVTAQPLRSPVHTPMLG
jgi:hypothetical protein